MRDRLVTVFGGGGFLGRHVAQALMDQGARVRVAQRDLTNRLQVKLLGDLGQIQFVSADITQIDSVAAAVAGSHIVINLVGILDGDFDAIHRRGAENIARAASDHSVEGLVHVSAMGAAADSPSAYGRSKAAGEAAVRAAYPYATILRPSIIFGADDQFLNRFAELIQRLPIVPVISGKTKFQPVYVKDVAHAIAKAAKHPEIFGGKTYELGGPQVLTMTEVNQWIAKSIGKHVSFVSLPDGLAKMVAILPGGPITRDQLAMLSRDNIMHVDSIGFSAFEIQPTPMGTVADKWLIRFRNHGRFANRVKI